MMHKVQLSALAALAVSMLSGAAHAEFVIERPEQAVAAEQRMVAARQRNSTATAFTSIRGARNVNPSASGDRISKYNRQRIDLESRISSRITQSGASPAELPPIRGMGRRVTLEDALRQVVPAGWEVYSDQQAPLESEVDWDGGRTWPMVMHSVMSSMDMRAHIDWDAQELVLFVPAPKQEPVAEVMTAEAAAAAASAATQTAATKNAAKPPVVWQIKPGSLRENLRLLASAAEWTLVWNAVHGDTTVDYDIESPGYSFTGGLIGADGVIAKVVDLYAQAERPLAVTFFHGNKVIEVRLHEIPDVAVNAPAPAYAPQRLPAPVARPPAPRVEMPSTEMPYDRP